MYTHHTNILAMKPLQSAYIEPGNILASQGHKLMLEKLLVKLERRILGCR